MMDIVSALLEAQVPVDRLGRARRAASPRAPGRSSRWPRTSRTWRPGRASAPPRRSTRTARTSRARSARRSRTTRSPSSRSIAEARHRPVDWAASTVSAARSSSAVEAVSLGVVDGIASTIEEVVAAGERQDGHGRRASRSRWPSPARRSRTSARTRSAGSSASSSNPNVAFLLFTVGVLALLFELQNPSLIVGIFGARPDRPRRSSASPTCRRTSPGSSSIAIGLSCSRSSRSIPSHGLLTIGGAGRGRRRRVGPVQPGRAERPTSASPCRILIVVAVTGAAFGLLITAMAIRTRRLAPPLARPARVRAARDVSGDVHRPLSPLGSIYAVGEEWSRPRRRRLAAATAARPSGSSGRDGLTVLVEPDPAGLP